MHARFKQGRYVCTFAVLAWCLLPAPGFRQIWFDSDAPTPDGSEIVTSHSRPVTWVIPRQSG